MKCDLLPFACAKYRVLKKEPKSKRINATDTFAWNTEFTCKLFKSRPGQVVTKQTDEEFKKTKTKVDEDRKFKVDAAIVRIMKARKTLDHRNLVADVMKQLQSRFIPNPVTNQEAHREADQARLSGARSQQPQGLDSSVASGGTEAVWSMAWDVDTRKDLNGNVLSGGTAVLAAEHMHKDLGARARSEGGRVARRALRLRRLKGHMTLTRFRTSRFVC